MLADNACPYGSSVMTAVIVAGLVEEGAKLEIEATAVIPDRGR